MRETPVDLYRMGNAIASRLAHIRDRDIVLFEENDETWVAANSGGISTFAVLGNGKNWWKLDQGTEIPPELRLVNDYGHHWLWEPSYRMTLDDYRRALQNVGERFYKVN